MVVLMLVLIIRGNIFFIDMMLILIKGVNVEVNIELFCMIIVIFVICNIKII